MALLITFCCLTNYPAPSWQRSLDRLIRSCAPHSMLTMHSILQPTILLQVGNDIQMLRTSKDKYCSHLPSRLIIEYVTPNDRTDCTRNLNLLSIQWVRAQISRKVCGSLMRCVSFNHPETYSRNTFGNDCRKSLRWNLDSRSIF